MKKKLKKIECEICGNRELATLHKHHIIERTQLNTTNHPMNLAVICSNCHNKVHAGIIKIIGLYPSTKLPYGRTLIYDTKEEKNSLGITEAYYKPEPKQMKIFTKE